MDVQTLPIAAGTMSTLLFVSAHIPMLVKAYKTRNLRSYSLGNIVLSNVGNLLYWLYILNLPPGPIWVLHSFYTVTTALMLFWYLRYERSRAADYEGADHSTASESNIQNPSTTGHSSHMHVR